LKLALPVKVSLISVNLDRRPASRMRDEDFNGTTEIAALNAMIRLNANHFGFDVGWRDQNERSLRSCE
jgi:hypothetical protein